MRSFRAFLLAPLAPALFVAVALSIIAMGDLGPPTEVIVGLAGVLWLGEFFSYLATLVIGLPAYLILRGLRLSDRAMQWLASPVAAMIGAGVGMYVASSGGGQPSLIWVGALLGVVAGMSFVFVYWDGGRAKPLFSGTVVGALLLILVAVPIGLTVVDGRSPDVWRTKATEIWQGENNYFDRNVDD